MSFGLSYLVWRLIWDKFITDIWPRSYWLRGFFAQAHRYMDKKPWITKKIETVYDNDWIKVTHREVTNPAGNPGIYGVVSFKNKAIGIVPIDSEGNIWLVKQFRYTLDQYTWEIPEGGCPEGQTPLEAAKRELKEETGLVAAQWERIAQFHTSNSVTDEYGEIFLAQDLTIGAQELEDSEDIVLKKIPLREAVQMVMDGEITDAVSMIGLMKATVVFER